MVLNPPVRKPHPDDEEHLEERARQLATSHTASRRPGHGKAFLSLLQRQERLLLLAHRYFESVSEEQLGRSYTAAEWMLDNFYVVRQSIRQIRDDMPGSYYRQLPKLDTTPLKDHPRVYAVARELLDACESQLDLDRIVRFVRAYQHVVPMTTGELWALPTMLRLGVLEILAQATARIAGLETGVEEDVSAVLPTRRIQTGEAIVANCIINLRMLATQDWKAFFEDVSRVESILRRDPADVYAQMDFDTRDRYRGVVEELALATGHDEEEVAWEAIRLAESAREQEENKDLPRTSHIGFYLIDAGRTHIEKRLGYHSSWTVRSRRWLLGHPLLVYLGTIALFALAAWSGLILYAEIADGTLAQLVGVALLASSPVIAIAVDLVNWLVTHGVPPRVLPRMDYREGIPAECSTMVVIPSLLSEADEIKSLVHQLELHYLANTDPHIYFALLTDWADAPQKHMPPDYLLLNQARASIQKLNRRYGRDGGSGPFYLFHRERRWNPAEECWMGWERKRGKLAEFNHLLTGSQNTSYIVRMGNPAVLSKIRYVITLDADTLLPRDSARRLIATLAHPLNRAVFDPQSGVVVAGYTVLQPRMQVKPTLISRSRFTRTFAGDVGLDLYTRAVSDVYQDLFGEGNYVGKGIYDVAAFERSLEGRVPDNALLSHDLFEGIHGRAGLVTDVTLFEDYPLHYDAYVRRLHRWVRGDWQLLPWLLPRVPRAGGGTIPSDLSALDRWKIIDNLRRSLLRPALLALFVAGWLWLPGAALPWTLLAGLALATTLILDALTWVIQHLRHRIEGDTSPPARGNVQASAARWLFALVFLPHESWRMVDAIVSTLVRLTITHRHLLQWTTSAHTIRLFGKERKLRVVWRSMGGSSILALALAVLTGLFRLRALPVAAPALLGWLISPQVAYWISRPTDREPAQLLPDQLQQLRRLARRTWLYFEQFIGPDEHWLPPDHFQEDPRGLVAHRTSPTNIGLLLLSTLAAHDLGHIGLMDLALRLRSTFDTMEKLERYRGHFLNWYDTRHLDPLPPRYVSTVDSGNLAACLLAFKQGCLDIPTAPILRWQRLQGLLDTIDVLADILNRPWQEVKPKKKEAGGRAALGELLDYLDHTRQRVLAAQNDPDRWGALLTWLSEECWAELNQRLMSLVEAGLPVLSAPEVRDLRTWSQQVRYQLFSLRPELDLLLPWLVPVSQPPALFTQPETDAAIQSAWQALRDALTPTPSLRDLPDVCTAGEVRLARLRDLLVERSQGDVGGPGNQSGDDSTQRLREALEWCEHLAEGFASAPMVAEGLTAGFQDLTNLAEAYFQAMEFGFLFNPTRKVFHIGYNVSAGRPDANHYDLLASEARLASLVAIAKGDVPQSHWLHLARPITRLDGRLGLLSWSGTMFEYLMPPLLVHNYANTLLDQACHTAVDRQIAYGHRKGIPWGISESGYYRFDANLNYQYRAFGVPGLGLKRGLEKDLVVAPYASLLALSLRPQAVVQNITRLIEQGMFGPYGFYEAIDYTPSRLPLGQSYGIVRSYMVHHHGMSLLALTNFLQDEVMVRRFHADPLVQSVELLLCEQLPHRAPIEATSPEEAGVIRPHRPPLVTQPWHVPIDTPAPWVHFLSNGRYGVLITNAGSGFSRWQEIDLTRWRSDPTLDDWGTWIYVQDADRGDLWSAGSQPTGSQPEDQGVSFYVHKAEFHRLDHDISLRMEITVSPEDDVEIRRLILTNQGRQERLLRLTSYGEVVLAPQAADRRHQAFNKLFIESEYLPEVNGLLFRRRPRSADETPIYLLHLLVVEEGQAVTGTHESDRARFLGRGGSPRSPAALSRDGRGLSGTTGATLDPIMALGQEISLGPHETTRVAFLTLAADSRQEAERLAWRYRTWAVIDHAFERARAQGEMELRQLGLSTSDVENIQRLLSALLYPSPELRAAPEILAANVKGQPGLWPFAISGDYPILLVRVSEEDEAALVRELLQAHAYWRKRQIKVDLVIVNERESGYDQELHGQLHRLIARTGGDAWLNQRGGIFLLRGDQMNHDERVLLETVARVALDASRGSLGEQLRQVSKPPTRLPRFVPTRPRAEADALGATPPLSRPADLLFDNGIGGFRPDSREYVIYLERGQGAQARRWTPAPWVNVVANPHFGFLVSETGAGYTWAENSGENRLTRWHNDPIADTTGEALYLRDEETGEVWSPTPLPCGAPLPYLIRHGAGYSIFEHHSHGLRQRLRLFVIPDAPVKVIHLRLENSGKRNRRITATFFADWVLGTTQDVTRQYLIPEFDAFSDALLARNPYNVEFGERTAFLTASREPFGLTTDRTEFLGRQGELRCPAGLERVGLASTVRAGLDPCAALQTHVWLAPGEVEEVFFLLGQGEDRREALRLIERYRSAEQIEVEWERVHALWDDLLSTITVETPDPAMDLLLNCWLLYQALSCRVWGRSALYQSSGAFGYRDQLQDVMALTFAAPNLARDHILEAARHQFEAGDVLHWWHPPSGRGVRTRCSDDLLWLPFVTAHYIAATGDETILKEQIPFLVGKPLTPEERECYSHYEATAESFSLYEHCRRALDKGITSGPHGLPLIGSHDWNDGLNQVGVEGRGESVWLGWFLYATLTRFAAVCEHIGDEEQAAAYHQQARQVRRALEENGWDGAWYRRAYYDDGTPLGSAENDECQIASIAQSWSVLSGAADPDRAARAVDAVSDRLVRWDDRLVLLFTPPFDKTTHDPGYIKGYPPGIRENGGQYTHAALWAVWAFAELGQGDHAEALFHRMDVVHRLCQLDVPRWSGSDSGATPGGQGYAGRSMHPRGMARLQANLPLCRHHLPDSGGESRRRQPGREAFGRRWRTITRQRHPPAGRRSGTHCPRADGLKQGAAPPTSQSHQPLGQDTPGVPVDALDGIDGGEQVPGSDDDAVLWQQHGCCLLADGSFPTAQCRNHVLGQLSSVCRRLLDRCNDAELARLL